MVNIILELERFVPNSLQNQQDLGVEQSEVVGEPSNRRPTSNTTVIYDYQRGEEEVIDESDTK